MLLTTRTMKVNKLYLGVAYKLLSYRRWACSTAASRTRPWLWIV